MRNSQISSTKIAKVLSTGSQDQQPQQSAIRINFDDEQNKDELFDMIRTDNSVTITRPDPPMKREQALPVQRFLVKNALIPCMVHDYTDQFIQIRNEQHQQMNQQLKQADNLHKKMQEYIQSKVPDISGDICIECKEKFGLLNRKNICASCRKPFCKKCKNKMDDNISEEMLFNEDLIHWSKIDNLPWVCNRCAFIMSLNDAVKHIETLKKRKPINIVENTWKHLLDSENTINKAINVYNEKKDQLSKQPNIKKDVNIERRISPSSSSQQYDTIRYNPYDEQGSLISNINIFTNADSISELDVTQLNIQSQKWEQQISDDVEDEEIITQQKQQSKPQPKKQQPLKTPSPPSLNSQSPTSDVLNLQPEVKRQLIPFCKESRQALVQHLRLISAVRQSNNAPSTPKEPSRKEQLSERDFFMLEHTVNVFEARIVPLQAKISQIESELS